ncbi:unnamed protein product [Paramecium primaurelia]|uniref:Protein YIPF n=1 Tax=Paramecium primaurelia TaxID=5886 RepID=A0A8S1QPS6_PARPR|nr:unnamed protein product [Paramecium primaurelia]
MDFFSKKKKKKKNIQNKKDVVHFQQSNIINLTLMSLKMMKDFHECFAGNPDLQMQYYISRGGPLRISATIIINLILILIYKIQFNNVFLITAVANINQMNLEGQTTYSVAYVPQSAALLYCISFGTPVILTLVMKILGSDIRFFHTLCLYGYSMSILMPITILCVIRNSILQWCLVGYGMISSSSFLIMGMRKILGDLEQSKRYIIIGIVLAMQFSLYLLYKLVFFKVIEKNSTE